MEKPARENGLVAAFAIVGFGVLASGFISRKLTFGRVQGAAIAILIGLALAYVGGRLSGGTKGLADLALFSGIGLMGGNMLRDFAIVARAFEVPAEEARRAGWIGALALLLGTVVPFIVGVGVARAFGYSDAVSMTTIGAGAITYIVGPVTDAAIGASSDVMALSIATGARLRYLPPYSPDFNPIENLGSKVKQRLRSLAPRTDKQLLQAFVTAIATVSAADCHGFFLNSQYAI